MTDTSPVFRTPVEIWERILALAIDVEDVFDATCSSANYMAFRRTCSDGRTAVSRHSYYQSEQTRGAIRLVCQSWKAVADLYANRWLRPYRQPTVDQLMTAKRIDVLSMDGNLTTFRLWHTIWRSKPFAPRLCRLEILGSWKSTFEGDMKALWEASSSLKHLRSLTIGTVADSPDLLGQISRNFPQITHLSLIGPLAILKNQAQLSLSKLEILFLSLDAEYFNTELDSWRLPSLKHIRLAPGTPYLRQSETFLLMLGENLLTLDLDDREASHEKFEIPYDFWNSFPRLQLLRGILRRIKFKSYPSSSHPLKHVMDVEQIEHEDHFISSVRPWLTHDIELETIAIYGVYLTYELHLHSKNEEVLSLIRLSRWNGVRLINPAGKEWVKSI